MMRMKMKWSLWMLFVVVVAVVVVADAGPPPLSRVVASPKETYLY